MSQRTVGSYEILKKLGEGGMGVVYQARDKALDRLVALKFLRAEAAGEVERRRFTREAMAASALDHPNICTIYQIGTADDGQLFIAMAYYEGDTVSTLLSGGPLSIEQALDVSAQAAEGLAKAHANKVVHRDIKPANLLVTRDGLVKILDFGLARTGVESELTGTGEIMGTLAYMSPEQVRAQRTDHRTDIWSLGVVLYEMLTGKRPFTGTPAAAVRAIQGRTPEPLRRIRSEVPPALADIVGRAMAKKLEQRYALADEMLADLNRLRHGPISAGPSSGARTLSQMPAAVPPPSVTQEMPSVAVLPFVNVSADPDNEYFSDGLTDELIHALAKHDGLRVISRTSVFELKNQNMSLPEIAQLLGVDSLLEGSVRKAGNQVRIVARLVGAANEQQIWSERFDREVQDVFAVQDEIATTIARQLEVRLTSGSGATRAPRVYKGSVEVYELYLKGRHFWNRRHLEQARKCFEEALAMDPAFALAHAGMANYHVILGIYGGINPSEVWPRVRQFALRALELDRTLPEAHIALAYLRSYEEWDWPGARRELLTALQLSWGAVDTHLAYTMHLMQTGQFEAGAEHLRIAKSLDPLSTLVHGFELGCLVYRGDYARAIALGRRALETAPEAVDVPLFLGIALQHDGQFEEALSMLRQASKSAGEGALTLGFLGACCAAAGEREEAEAILERLRPATPETYVPPTARAFIQTALGRTGEALGSLEEAARLHDPMICYAKVMPGFGPLRGESRFVRLLEMIGLSATG